MVQQDAVARRIPHVSEEVIHRIVRVKEDIVSMTVFF